MDVDRVGSSKSSVIRHPENYLQKHAIPHIIRSIVSGLAMERPADHYAYIKEKLQECKKVEEKLDINWETFVYHLHPYRNEKRLELIHDYSPFYLEHLDKTGQLVPGLIHIENAVYPYERPHNYQPDLFKLTEMSDTAGPSNEV